MHLQKLRNLNVDRMDIDDAVELMTNGKQIAATYGGYGVSAPTWLLDALSTLDLEIKRRHSDMLQSRRRDLLAAQKSLRTREQRAADIAAELESLNNQLGIGNQVASGAP